MENMKIIIGRFLIPGMVELVFPKSLDNDLSKTDILNFATEEFRKMDDSEILNAVKSFDDGGGNYFDDDTLVIESVEDAESLVCLASTKAWGAYMSGGSETVDEYYYTACLSDELEHASMDISVTIYNVVDNKINIVDTVFVPYGSDVNHIVDNHIRTNLLSTSFNITSLNSASLVHEDHDVEMVTIEKDKLEQIYELVCGDDAINKYSIDEVIDMLKDMNRVIENHQEEL